MKVVILASSDQEKEIKMCKDIFMRTGWEVVAPAKQKDNVDKVSIILDYFNEISYADLVFVIEKPDGSIGDGVMYEIAYAKRCGVPIIYNTTFTSMLESYMSLKED